MEMSQSGLDESRVHCNKLTLNFSSYGEISCDPQLPKKQANPPHVCFTSLVREINFQVKVKKDAALT